MSLARSCSEQGSATAPIRQAPSSANTHSAPRAHQRHHDVAPPDARRPPARPRPRPPAARPPRTCRSAPRRRRAIVRSASSPGRSRASRSTTSRVKLKPSLDITRRMLRASAENSCGAGSCRWLRSTEGGFADASETCLHLWQWQQPLRCSCCRARPLRAGWSRRATTRTATAPATTAAASATSSRWR